MAQAFRTRSGQRGISFMGLLLVGTIVACVMVVGAQIVSHGGRVPGGGQSGEQGQCRLYRA
jgi:hypothetical protein